MLEVALPGNRMIQFFLFTNSEGSNDFLYFEVDGVRLVENFSAPLNSIVRPFNEVNVLLSGNARTLKWCYTKNGMTDAGGDIGLLDRLSFSDVGDPSNIPLTRGGVCHALDMSAANCALIDSVAAEPSGLPWVLSTIATTGGNLSLRSADIGNSQTSCLVLGITLPDDRNLRFSLRTDSEAVNDFLYFEVGGTRLVDRFSAPQGSTLRDWEQLNFLISDSISSLKWCYTKNGSTSSDADSGWLDALTFTVPGVTKEQLCAALDMSSEDCAIITGVFSLPPPELMLAQQLADVPWVLSSSEATEGSQSLRSGDIDDNQASCLALEVTVTAGSVIRFSLRTDSEGLFDHLIFAVDNQTVIERFFGS